MNYLNFAEKKLSIAEIKLLRDALLDCHSFRDYTRRRFIVDELNQRYPSINLKSTDSDPGIFTLHLIQLCQDYDGALEYLIELIDGIFEHNSLGVQHLRMTIGNIFSSPKVPSLIREGNSWVIRVNQTGQVINIPFVRSPIDGDKLKEAIELPYIYTWKAIHTRCEILIRDFMSVYKYIWSERVNLVIDHLLDFRERCNIFSYDLEKLDQRIFTFEPIQYLKIIPFCIDPLLDTMSYPPKSNYFILEQEFSEFIIDALFEALRLADRILEEYIEQKTV
ncbi:MAG: hypothetical protein GPJ21_09095 [Microcystis aeruginosa W13-11]|nr:hypothetical protein [Microcystis aeruginosa W13-11]